MGVTDCQLARGYQGKWRPTHSRIHPVDARNARRGKVVEDPL
jgi:hypothetical protein